MTLKSYTPKEDHENFRLALIQALRGFDGLSPQELLAISAQFVGQLMAMQDQKSMTPAMAIELVIKNIQIGNNSVVDQVKTPVGNA